RWCAQRMPSPGTVAVPPTGTSAVAPARRKRHRAAAIWGAAAPQVVLSQPKTAGHHVARKRHVIEALLSSGPAQVSRTFLSSVRLRRSFFVAAAVQVDAPPP